MEIIVLKYHKSEIKMKEEKFLIHILVSELTP